MPSRTRGSELAPQFWPTNGPMLPDSANSSITATASMRPATPKPATTTWPCEASSRVMIAPGNRTDCLRRHRRQADRREFPATTRTGSSAKARRAETDGPWRWRRTSRIAVMTSRDTHHRDGSAGQSELRHPEPAENQQRIQRQVQHGAAGHDEPRHARIARRAHHAAGDHRDREQDGAGIVDQQIRVNVLEYLVARAEVRKTSGRSSQRRLRREAEQQRRRAAGYGSTRRRTASQSPRADAARDHR